MTPTDAAFGLIMKCPECDDKHLLRQQTFYGRMLNGYLDEYEMFWCGDCLQSIWLDGRGL